MKLAFTTLGCPDWDLETILKRASEYGFVGIDFRGYLGKMFLGEYPEFTAERKETAALIKESGIQVAGFSTGSLLMETDRKSKADNMEEFRFYAELCPEFETEYIRIFGGSIGGRTWDQAIEEAADVLSEMACIAGDNNTSVLLETHDAWVHNEHIRSLMEKVDSPHAGILWDIHHPWRAAKEEPEETWSQLKLWIKNTHWKDAKGPDHDLCLVGEGDLPLDTCFTVLQEGGYEGYYTLEWEKKHHPELPDPEKAFPGYVQFIKQLNERMGA